MAEWLKAHAWKVCLGLKLNGGSNPLPSAINAPDCGRFFMAFWDERICSRGRRFGGRQDAISAGQSRNIFFRSLTDSFEERVEFKAQKIENFIKNIQKYVKNTYHCVYFNVKT